MNMPRRAGEVLTNLTIGVSLVLGPIAVTQVVQVPAAAAEGDAVTGLETPPFPESTEATEGHDTGRPYNLHMPGDLDGMAAAAAAATALGTALLGLGRSKRRKLGNITS